MIAFFPYKSLYFRYIMNVTQQCRCLYFELGVPVVELTGLFILLLIMSGKGCTPGLYGWGGRWEFFEGKEGFIFLGSTFGYSTSPVFFFLFWV